MSSSLQLPEEQNVQRNKSLKARLRNLSSRRKTLLEDGVEEETRGKRFSMSADTSGGKEREEDSPTSSFSYDIRPHSAAQGISQERGRTQGRVGALESSGKSPSFDASNRIVQIDSSPLLSQAHMAIPILSMPTITSTEHTSSLDAVRTGEKNALGLKEDSSTPSSPKQAPAPVLIPNGFLTSVFNVATNLTTALGAGSARTPPTRLRDTTVDRMNDNVNTPSRNALPEQLGPNPQAGPPVASLGLGELSLKDMGISDAAGQDSPQLRTTRPRTSSNLTADTSLVSSDNTSLIPETKDPRSGSVNTMQTRRRRGSTTVSVFGPDTQGQKITGFAVASNKRNREFHATFRSVPDADYLLDDYGCALQKEILVHGRMYVSESHICFNSNIFGWVTNLVIAFTDIISIEKRSTAGIFPNAIQISTLQAKHVFASFISRDTTYELVVNIWRLTHPLIQTTAHGVEIAEDDDYRSDSSSSAGSDDQESSEEALSGSGEDSDPLTPRRPSFSSRDSPKLVTESAPKQGLLGSSIEFPGPAEHSQTEAPSLSDGSAFTKDLTDEYFDAPLGQIYELLYGDDKTFMQDFLAKNQKLLEVQINPFSDRSGKSVRTLSYVKPLSGPIGPRQTRCLIEDVVEMKDLDKCIQIVQATTSPDVPSGDAFVVRTRFSLMWGPRNSTRLVTNCMIEWTKTSWIKGSIEKAVNSGQVQFTSDLVEAIRNHLALYSTDRKKRTKAKKSKERSEETALPALTSQPREIAPATGFLGISGILNNINTNLLVFVLLFGMMFAMMRMQRSIQELTRQSRSSAERPFSVQWQHEESDLWTWLADRTTSLLREDTDLGHLQSQQGLTPTMTALQIREALSQQIAVLKKAEDLAALQAKYQ